MSFLSTLVAGVLPGTRSLRVPLISGLLWTLVCWIVASPYLPDRADSTGWVSQFFAIVDFLGPAISIAVATVMVFILGATLGTVSDGFNQIVGGVVSRLARAWRWQVFAQRARRGLRSQKLKIETELLKLQNDRRAPVPNKLLSSPASDALEKRLQHDLEAHKKRLHAVSSPWLRNVWLRRNAKNLKNLGNPPAEAFSGLELELVDAARADGRALELAEAKRFLGRTDIEKAVWNKVENSSDNDLLAEFSSDPLDVLRSVDEKLYLELDRLRSERELRLAIAVPLLMLAVLAAMEWRAGWPVVAAIPLAMIFRYSIEAQQERTRVLTLIRLHSLRTPALRRAFEAGRADVRLALSAEQAGET